MPLLSKNFSDNNSISAIWKISENDDYFNQNIVLNKNDRFLLEKINNLNRKREIISVRFIMKYLGINQEITYNEFGKPLINNGKISISHSNNLVGIIFHSKFECSIDIEKISERVNNIKNKVFDFEELKYAQNDLKLLTILWSSKECIYKILNYQSGIDFKEQIKIMNLEENGYINAEFINNNIVTQMKLNYFEIQNYIVVWYINTNLKSFC